MLIFASAIFLLSGFTIYLWREKRLLARRLSRQMERERYREIFENAPDAYFVIEAAPAGNFFFKILNPEALRIMDPDGMGIENLYFDEIARRTGNRESPRILQELSSHLTRSVQMGMPLKYTSTFHFKSELFAKTYDINLVPMADDGGISHILCFARDVTARKLYEQELLERVKLEERVSSFAGSAPGFFFTYRHGTDGSNSMPFASAGINNLFGLQPGDVAQDISPLSLLIHQDDLKSFFDATAYSAAHMLPLQVEFRVVHPDKGELWVESRAQPQLQLGGAVMWHGFMHDVTGRKHYEQSLLERAELEQRQSQFFSVAPGYFYTSVRHANGHNAMPFSSSGIRDLFGLEPADVALDSMPLLALIHPDDREDRWRRIEESARNLTRLHYECRIIHPLKGVRWLEAHSLPRPLPEGGMRWDGFMHDITDRKQAEMQLTDTQNKLRELVLSREALREDERKRIAWEMHEELGQLLAAMKMHIYGMRTQFPKDNLVLKESSLAVGSLIDKSIKTIHDMVSDLRPTALLHGIAPALEWLVAEFNKHPDMACELTVEENGAHIGDEMITQVFRIAQESLEYVARHAGVMRVFIEWKTGQHGHVLTIRHDGHANAGDLADDQSPGFFGIQERVKAFGGEMRIFSELQHRSVIEAYFPASDAPVE